MYQSSNIIQGGTYAGNAVSCAAAVAVADVMREENILLNVQARFVVLSVYLNPLCVTIDLLILI